MNSMRCSMLASLVAYILWSSSAITSAPSQCFQMQIFCHGNGKKTFCLGMNQTQRKHFSLLNCEVSFQVSWRAVWLVCATLVGAVCRCSVPSSFTPPVLPAPQCSWCTEIISELSRQWDSDRRLCRWREKVRWQSLERQLPSGCNAWSWQVLHWIWVIFLEK